MALSCDIPILYEESWAVWIDKPPGLLSVPGLGPGHEDCVVSRVSARNPGGWCREAHRLDQATSGVMLVALEPGAHRSLMRQFRQRGLVEKEYEAVVLGFMKANAGVIRLPIRADIDNRPRQIVDDEHGKDSVTNWEVIDRDEDRGWTRLRLVPETGRTHQLRVHLASIGHPIVGDDLYGGVVEESERLMLHATRLVVRDVNDEGHRIDVRSKCPF